jgi:hypothetical protein
MRFLADATSFQGVLRVLKVLTVLKNGRSVWCADHVDHLGKTPGVLQVFQTDRMDHVDHLGMVTALLTRRGFQGVLRVLKVLTVLKNGRSVWCADHVDHLGKRTVIASSIHRQKSVVADGSGLNAVFFYSSRGAFL